MLRHVSGGLFSPVWPWKAGPTKEGHSPSQGGAAGQHWKGHTSFWGWCTIQGQAQCCAPQAARVPRPHRPSLCLTLANLSSLFLSFAPSWPSCLPGDFRHPPEHLRSLAFAPWPSNSSFSSAAASPQFSATGSTPSHKKADLPGRPLPFAQTMHTHVWLPQGLGKSLGPDRPAGALDEARTSLYFG